MPEKNISFTMTFTPEEYELLEEMMRLQGTDEPIAVFRKAINMYHHFLKSTKKGAADSIPKSPQDKTKN